MKKVLLIIVSFAVAISTYHAMPPSVSEPARRMSFIFICAGLFWALEIIPIWVTSIFIVLLEMFLISPLIGGNYADFLTPISNPIIMLFFGGFVLAVALNKYDLDILIAKKLLMISGTKPGSVLIGYMGITALLSMWVSNTATTALLIVMARPVIRDLDIHDPFRKAIPLAIAFGANIGGIGTPVGTPPNAIGIGLLAREGIHIGFITWMMMAIPLVIITLIITWLILLAIFPPHADNIVPKFNRPSQWTDKTTMVSTISILIIILWLTSGITNVPLAIAGLIGAFFFFGLGLLNQDDLKKIEWDILILMAGGLALGKGMDLTGLTDFISSSHIFSLSGIYILLGVCTTGLVLSTFMSNTATANLLIPIAIGLSGVDTILMVVALSISCSFAMAFPVSTPPNAIAYSTQTFSTKDLIKVGGLLSIIGLALTVFGGKVMIGMFLKIFVK